MVRKKLLKAKAVILAVVMALQSFGMPVHAQTQTGLNGGETATVSDLAESAPVSELGDPVAASETGNPEAVYDDNEPTAMTETYVGVSEDTTDGVDVSTPKEGEIAGNDTAEEYASSGRSSVAKLSMKELADLYEGIGSYSTLYKTAPVISGSGYKPSVLTNDAYNYVKRDINYYRTVAGLGEISLTDELNTSASWGALVLAMNSELNHFPDKPADMSQEDYDKGYAATSSSNLSYASSSDTTVLYYAVEGQMADSIGDSNVACLGHRRWLLRPGTTTMGVGTANNSFKYYTAVRVFNINEYGNAVNDYDFIAWPASGNNLSNTFTVSTPWSVTLNPSNYSTPDRSSVTVKVESVTNKTTWTFNSGTSTSVSSTSDYFNVNTEGYGVNNCIIFRPAYSSLSAFSGDYIVTISGIKDKSGNATTLKYKVTFDTYENASQSENMTISLNETEKTLYVGETLPLTVTIDPPEAGVGKTITWSSSNENVATVSDGVVTAVGVGTAKITVKTAKGGKTAVCQVTVVDRVEPLTGISLDKLPADMEAGELAAFTLSDILTPADTTETAESNVIWSYEPEGIVKYVEGKGLSALAAGTVTVTATAKSPSTGEEYSASKVVTVAGAFVYVDSITLDQTNVTLQPGDIVTLHAMVSPANANEKTVIWSYDTEYLRAVKEEGTSITLEALSGYGGSSYVYAETAGSSISAMCEVVVKKNDFEDGMDDRDVEDNGKNIFIASFESYHYTGKAVKPKVHVYSGSELLKEKTDYTVSYKNNIAATGMGTDKVPQVIVKLKGNYKGTITKNFTILPAEFSDGVVDVTRVCVPYKGKALTPVPVVTYNGKKLGKKDFSVKYYSDPSALEEYETVIDKPGLYYIEVNGEGNYEGRHLQECYVTDPTSTKELLVSKASIKLTKNKFEYDADPEKFGSEIEKAISTDIPVGELGISVADDEFYTVGKHVLILYGTGTDGDGDGKYYVGEKRINYTVTGIDLKKATIEFKKGNDGYTYNENEIWEYEEDIANDLNVSYNGKELVCGADYQIEYQYIKNVGKYTLTFRGDGAFTGVVKKTVVVNPVTINMTGEDPEFVISPEVTYEQGGKPEPQVFWMSKGRLLTAGKDYTFSYKKNVLTVKGKGNFAGTVSKEITFKNQKIWSLTATAADKVYSTKANAWMSKVVVTDTNGKKLKEGKDYEKLTADSYRYFGSAWKPVPEAGDTVTVTIKGKGNYEGEKEVSYRIVAADIAKAKVKVLDKSYSGSSVTLDAADLEVTIAKEGTLNMVSDDNADGYRIVSYQTNVKVGKATIVLKGCGKYGGTKKVTFKINPKEYVGNVK